MSEDTTVASAEPVAAKPEVRTVQLTDGRTTTFTSKAKANKYYIDAQGLETEDANTAVGVRFDFSDGNTRTIKLSDVQSLLARYTLHGILQKHGDVYAGEKDVEDAVIAFDDLHERTLQGHWTAPRAAGSFTGVSILVRALMEVYTMSAEEVKTKIKDMTGAEKTKLRAAPSIKPTIDRLEAEKAAKNAPTQAETDALLAKFQS